MIIPNLVKYYVDAMYHEYYAKVTVHHSHYPKFAKLEYKLISAGISSKHYAYTVAKLWSSWVEKKNMNCVTVTLFLNYKSLNWYMKHRQKASAELVKKEDQQLQKAMHIELSFAGLYLQRRMNGESISEAGAAAEYNKSLRSTDEVIIAWKECYATNRRPIQQVLEYFVSTGWAYRTKRHVTCYDDLIPVHLQCVIRKKMRLKCALKKELGVERNRLTTEIDELIRTEINLRETFNL